MNQEMPAAASPASPGQPPNSWLAVAAGLAICTAAAVLLVFVTAEHLKARPVNLRDHTLAMGSAIEQLFRDTVADPAKVRRAKPQMVDDEQASWYLNVFEIDVDGQSPEGLETILNREMQRLDVTVAAGECVEGKKPFHLSVAGRRFAEIGFMLPAQAAPPEIAGNDPVLLRLQALAGLGESPRPEAGPARAIPRRPTVAIILDDGGYGGPVTEAVLELDARLTLSILPGTPHAAETARRATEAGFEVLLHLPMESPEDPGWIATSTPADEMRRLLSEALERVPGAVGINNHMGSTFCTDLDALARFFAVMKERPLFFVDSRTTHETLIPEAARQAGVPATERNVFLDNDAREEQICGQFETLIEFARENGSAVAIGHFRPETTKSLGALLPELEKRGINLVHVSEVIQ